MKKIALLSCIAISSLIIQSCNTDKTAQVTKLSPNHFYDSIIANPLLKLIDIRTPEEFSRGSLGQAININYNAADFSDQLEWLDKTTPIFLYCQSGGRTQEAIAIAEKQGFKQIYVLEGGLLAWRNAQLPFTEVADKNVLDLQDPERVAPDQFDKIINQHKNVIIDFKAEWCGPCKKISPVLVKMEKENAGKFVVYKIDTDKSPELSRKVGISSIPHLMVYKNGKKVEDIIGFANEEQLKAQILKHF